MNINEKMKMARINSLYHKKLMEYFIGEERILREKYRIKIRKKAVKRT